MCTNPHVGVDLFLQATDLSQMLTYCFLKVQDTATLFLRVAGDLQLETHTLLPLAVLLNKAKDLANQHKTTHSKIGFQTITDNSNLASGFHMEQQVIDYVQDHGVLHWIGGNLQVIVDEGEGVDRT